MQNERTWLGNYFLLTSITYCHRVSSAWMKRLELQTLFLAVISCNLTLWSLQLWYILFLLLKFRCMSSHLNWRLHSPTRILLYSFRQFRVNLFFLSSTSDIYWCLFVCPVPFEAHSCINTFLIILTMTSHVMPKVLTWRWHIYSCSQQAYSKKQSWTNTNHSVTNKAQYLNEFLWILKCWNHIYRVLHTKTSNNKKKHYKEEVEKRSNLKREETINMLHQWARIPKEYAKWEKNSKTSKWKNTSLQWKSDVHAPKVSSESWKLSFNWVKYQSSLSRTQSWLHRRSWNRNWSYQIIVECHCHCQFITRQQVREEKNPY